MAEGHVLFGAALCAALEDEFDLEVAGAAATMDEAVREARGLTPDVVLIDADLPPEDGIATCAAIKSTDLPSRVLVLSDQPDQELLLQALEAGADGYLDRSSELSEVVAAVRRLHAGEACIPPGMLGALLRGLIERRRGEDSAVDRYSRLSRREKEVFGLLVAGLDNRAIARELVVSPHTARTHVQKVLEKLQVHSRVEAATLAVEYNLIERFAGKR